MNCRSEHFFCWFASLGLCLGSMPLWEWKGCGKPAGIAEFWKEDRKISLNPSAKIPWHAAVLGEAVFCKQDINVTVLTTVRVCLTAGTEQLELFVLQVFASFGNSALQTLLSCAITEHTQTNPLNKQNSSALQTFLVQRSRQHVISWSCSQWM